MKKQYVEPTAEKLEFDYVLTTEESGTECYPQGMNDSPEQCDAKADMY